MRETQVEAQADVISIPAYTLSELIMKAREFDAEVEPYGLEGGSNALDDGGVGILEDTRDNPTEAEPRSVLRSLNEDQLVELLALVWVGRGDYDQATWTEALDQARSARNSRAVNYLMGTPLLGDLIEEGLAQLNVSLP